MKMIIKEMGVEIPKGLKMLFAKDNSQNSFSLEILKKVFKALSSNSDYIKFPTFMPYLTLFFMCSVFRDIEQRRVGFLQMLDKGYKKGIYSIFMRAGLPSYQLDEKVINYRMIEKVLLDLKV
mmetsp:Transcript_7583/g.6932  ORF Transcript_7583/g.6932 Transcript_7583/m.6932 type:complete len:122 (+) Transcript_7583:1265-1630(+)